MSETKQKRIYIAEGIRFMSTVGNPEAASAYSLGFGNRFYFKHEGKYYHFANHIHGKLTASVVKSLKPSIMMKRCEPEKEIDGLRVLLEAATKKIMTK